MFSSKPPIKPSRVSVVFDSKSQNDDLRSIFDFASGDDNPDKYLYLDGNAIRLMFKTCNYHLTLEPPIIQPSISYTLRNNVDGNEDVMIYHVNNNDLNFKLTKALHDWIAPICRGWKRPLIFVTDEKTKPSLVGKFADSKITLREMKTADDAKSISPSEPTTLLYEMKTVEHFKPISLAANTVLYTYAPTFGGAISGPFSLIHDYIIPDAKELAAINRNELMRLTHQLTHVPTWNEDLRHQLHAYAQKKIADNFNGNKEMFRATYIGKVIQSLHRLNDDAAKFYDNEADAKTAYTTLVREINDVIQNKIFTSDCFGLFRTNEPMRNFLVKLVKHLKPVTLVNTNRPGG